MFARSKNFHVLLVYVTILITTSCKQKKLFDLIDSSSTGIAFENVLTESSSENVLTYEYFYNGAGVAAGDFNNDGKIDLYFVANQGANKLYLNGGNLKFVDVTAQAGVECTERWKTGVTVADVNADGFLDIYICHSGPVAKEQLSNELYINNGCKEGDIPTFTEKAKEFGLDAPYTFSTQAAFFDFDRDGDLDMFLLNHGVRFYSPTVNVKKLRTQRHPQAGNRLYRNDSFKESSGKYLPRFTDVSEEAGILGGGLNFGLGIGIADVNEDGWIDVYVTNDYDEQDFLYFNNKRGGFTELSNRSFSHQSKFAMGCEIADMNNDKLPDILVADMLPESICRQKMQQSGDEYSKYHLLLDSGYIAQQIRNTFQLNLGAICDTIPRFSEIGQLTGISRTDWSWSVLAGDYDNDGDKDIFISNGILRDFTNLDFIRFDYQNAKEAASLSNTPLQTHELVSKLPVNKTANYLFENAESLLFLDKTREWGFGKEELSYGAVQVDLDNDGDLDLVTNNTNSPASVWRNNATTYNNNHFLIIDLKEYLVNKDAIGAKVYVSAGGVTQVQTKMPTRGYQSATMSPLCFGLGKQTIADSVRIVWNDGSQTFLTNQPSNQRIDIQKESAVAALPYTAVSNLSMFSDNTLGSGVRFVHQENEYNDFGFERLIPLRYSRVGPFISTGDINGDGRIDFYVSGASGQSGHLYVQTASGAFSRLSKQPWELDSLSEDAGSALFDADNDGDLDLYIVSGSSEFEPGDARLQDRLYLNIDGKNFTKAAGEVLPGRQSGTSCLQLDFDQDGKMDLFIGGGELKGQYPMGSKSFLLHNESEKGQIRFKDVGSEMLPNRGSVGIVSDALWVDIDGDSKMELIIAAEWSPIRMFSFFRGQGFIEIKSSGLEHSKGMWRKLFASDIDNDGRMDLIAGNMGLNLPWRVSKDLPLVLYQGDFNSDGVSDPIMAQHQNGSLYPVASLDELSEQLPSTKKKFIRYKDYSCATVQDIFGADALSRAKKYEIETLTSCIIRNEGNLKFSLLPLTHKAQFSAVTSIIENDFDSDGTNEYLLLGNYFSYLPRYGPSDAGHGIFLKSINSVFKEWLPQGKAICIGGDIRSAAIVGDKIVVARNNDSVSVLNIR